MNYKFTLFPNTVEVSYTGKGDKAILDSQAFDDLMACFSNALIREKERFSGDILTSKSVEAVLWREANDQYKYYSGEDV